LNHLANKLDHFILHSKRLLQHFFLIILLCGIYHFSAAQDTLRKTGQTDSVIIKSDSTQTSADSINVQQSSFIKDSIEAARHNPRTAALYSAVVPGLGQAYNHKYWKIPIAYAGLGVAAGVFIFNYKQFILFRDAYRLSFSGQKTGNPFVDQYDPQDQERIRDIYRQYVDYSALSFMGVYLINIVDAIVDAHLYNFNVSNNLAFKLSPVAHPGYVGYGLLIQLDRRKKKKLFSSEELSSSLITGDSLYKHP
jgi:Family of unknown function (DUF5683)